MSEVILNGDMTRRYPALRQAGRYALKRLGESRSPAEIAQAASVSRRSLCTLARESLGMELMEAIGQDQAAQAKRLSEITEQPIAGICHDPAVQFRNLWQFRRAFHRSYGRSPTHYRQEVAKRRPPTHCDRHEENPSNGTSPSRESQSVPALAEEIGRNQSRADAHCKR